MQIKEARCPPVNIVSTVTLSLIALLTGV